MNILDKTIGFFNPAAGLRRAQMRKLLARAYDGAEKGRRTSGWNTTGSSANTEIAAAGPLLRDRSRDLVQNNPYAARALNAMVANLIGGGILPKSEAGRNAEALTLLFERWAKVCDADGQLNFAGIEALVCRTVKESGECLVRVRLRRPEDGLPVPIQLQVLEPDFLDSTKNGPAANGNLLIQGIEFDLIGRRVAYWLFENHPGETNLSLVGSSTSRRVLADSVIHIYEKARPGQVRGVPVFAPVMRAMRDLADYQDADLIRKKVEACFSAFVVQPPGHDPLTLGIASNSEDGTQRFESFEPGMVEYLRPGEDVKFGDPKPSEGIAEYMQVQLHGIAAGLGITYDMLTGDLSQVNYSSIRAGLVEYRREAEQWQWNVFIPMFAEVVWRKFVDAAELVGVSTGATPDYRVDWTTPRWDYVNPLDDVNADIAAVDGALQSRSEAIRRRGYDPKKVFAELGAEQELLTGLGLIADPAPVAARDPADEAIARILDRMADDGQQ